MSIDKEIKKLKEIQKADFYLILETINKRTKMIMDNRKVLREVIEEVYLLVSGMLNLKHEIGLKKNGQLKAIFNGVSERLDNLNRKLGGEKTVIANKDGFISPSHKQYKAESAELERSNTDSKLTEFKKKDNGMGFVECPECKHQWYLYGDDLK